MRICHFGEVLYLCPVGQKVLLAWVDVVFEIFRLPGVVLVDGVERCFGRLNSPSLGLVCYLLHHGAND